ncbi:MAG: response regulator transcription factor [Clostridia bacterium]|nr:response regulator transcription factor [Clostridia bacterium]
MNKARILLVDDHALFRKGIASLLNEVPEFEVIGEASNGKEGVEKALQLKPDIVVLDVEMPGLNGVKAVELIKNSLPECKVVMLTISDDDQNLFDSIKNGAQGYLLKSMDPDELIKEIKGLTKGEAALSKNLAVKILDEFARISKKEVQSGDPQDYNLTEREAEVLILVAQGFTNKEIASRLAITENTVKNHLCNIMEKLHLQNRVQLATFAWREGIVNRNS